MFILMLPPTPVPDGRGPAQAEEGERAARARERDAFESERFLRRQAAAGASAKRAKLELVSLNEARRPVSEICAALKASRQGCCAWKSRPSSAHAMRDEELAVAISQVRDEARGSGDADVLWTGCIAGIKTSTSPQ